MRRALRSWVADADTRKNARILGLPEQVPYLDYQDGRTGDLYLSLVGELFDDLRDEPENPRDWVALANALGDIAQDFAGQTRQDALLFSAAAYYRGGHSASAYLTMRQADPDSWSQDAYRACYDFLARPRQARSALVTELLTAVRSGPTDLLHQASEIQERRATEALQSGPEEWVAERILSSLVTRFGQTNIRSVLPDGDSARWDPLVASLLQRTPPVWDFFPSQIEAIEAGLLTNDAPYSLQMPTGAGKTALTETLMFGHLDANPDDVAVLLVPYRALARELRNSVARRLTAIGMPTRTVYGGTVPTQEESQDLEQVRAIIATPEAFTGVLARLPELAPRISLVVCDEGHLLDSPGRGVGLELLLARLLGRSERTPRVVFLSAIVPNIEEVNAWLGGTDQTVVKSTYRPADAEYAVLRPSGTGRHTMVDLQLRPVGTGLPARALPGFLSAQDFTFVNHSTRRPNTYPFVTIKTQAIAAARKALPLGTVAVFSATKRGDQGVVGLTEELLAQLDAGIPLPAPLDYVSDSGVAGAVADYLAREYGSSWIGTRALRSGTVVHHGDVPQETREALEELVSRARVRMVICTSTLAEGVNLPIRTLVLYSVQRRTPEGRQDPMLARDIRNLVGRAGRAGQSTKGLIICANPNQWSRIASVAEGVPAEDVRGALRDLIVRLQEALAERGVRLTNQILEGSPSLFSLVDGIDATLIELFRDDIGDEPFRALASSLARETFAAQHSDSTLAQLLSDVFALRADRLSDLARRGRLQWVRDTGTRPRLVDSALDDLLPLLEDLGEVESPLDDRVLGAILAWAYLQRDFRRDLRAAFPQADLQPPDNLPPLESLQRILKLWVAGESFASISRSTGLEVDLLLRLHSSVILNSLTTLVEQSVALIQLYLAESKPLADSIANLPDYLRFGVSTPASRDLMANGVRHRRAAVLLGGDPAMTDPWNLLEEPLEVVRALLTDAEAWTEQLGTFMFDRTVADTRTTSSA